MMMDSRLGGKNGIERTRDSRAWDNSWKSGGDPFLKHRNREQLEEKMALMQLMAAFEAGTIQIA